VGGGSGGSGGVSGGAAYDTSNGAPIGGLLSSEARGGDAAGYGGGGGGMGDGVYGQARAGAGGSGAVRIIWGAGRAFPNTLTTDQ
jgi:hypothetical protein